MKVVKHVRAVSHVTEERMQDAEPSLCKVQLSENE